jgi:MYXO-CTERM domain-containing protein
VRSWLACVLASGALAFAFEARATDGGLPEAGWDSGTVSPGAIVAAYCGDAPLQCMTAPLVFQKTVKLPFAFEYDTGWIPQSFKELQVRFYVKVPAETMVKMNGGLLTTWPAPLTLGTPGDRMTGLLRFDYGLQVGARGKIDVSILGIDIKWEGPLPYVPQIDFHLLGAESFDPWAFKPHPVSASAFTKPFELFKINVLGLAGIPSQIAEGGVALDVKGELKATYTTNEMVIVPALVPITAQGATTLHAFTGGAFVEYDVHPEGVVHYDGVLHLIPAFYIEVLGQEFKMPVYDFPLTMPIGDQDFVFEKVRVHVPLPDIKPFESKVVDFGDVVAGSTKKLDFTIKNVGEARARMVVTADKGQSVFKVLTGTLFADPFGGTDDLEIRFTPKKPGEFKATVQIASNDPDLPMQTIEVKGRAVGEAVPDDPQKDSGPAPAVDGGAPPSDGGGGWEFFEVPGAESGCGCRVGEGSGGARGATVWLGLVALAGLAVRRRRRGRP